MQQGLRLRCAMVQLREFVRRTMHRVLVMQHAVCDVVQKREALAIQWQEPVGLIGRQRTNAYVHRVHQ